MQVGRIFENLTPAVKLPPRPPPTEHKFSRYAERRSDIKRRGLEIKEILERMLLFETSGSESVRM